MIAQHYAHVIICPPFRPPAPPLQSRFRMIFRPTESSMLHSAPSLTERWLGGGEEVCVALRYSEHAMGRCAWVS